MKTFFLFLSIVISTLTFSQKDFSANAILGHEIGSDFSRHSQVVDFFEELNAAYPENSLLQPYGKTNEGRLLQLMFIGSKSTIDNIGKIHYLHFHNEIEPEKIPIVWLSYNVHGNESSGTEAAMKTALILLRDKQEWLENVLVIIDPCLNPDGRDRYVNFFKQYSSDLKNPDVNSLEHSEPWPGGRLNHYLFDLNRDWAWLTQVESQQRIKKYNQWLPHVHVDFHEQGINENYYFPPAAEPYHEIITDWQREFQEYIGENHSKYFDANNWLYFSKEIFDLLYPSYGDTYPMYNGAIGMTYEQAGSGRAGLSVVIDNGDTLNLHDRVEHHVVAGLSTVEVSIKNSSRLIQEFQDFSKNRAYKYKSYVLSGDLFKINSLLKLLSLHDIKVRKPKEGTLIKGWSYTSQEKTTYKVKSNDLLVSVDQLKGPMVKVLFEPQTFLSDSLTYDITAWSLPYAFGLNAIACETQVPFDGEASAENITSFYSYLEREQYGNLPPSRDPSWNSKESFAYVCKWNSMESARFLEKLLASNVKVRYAEKSFKIEGERYEPGTLVIVKGENTEQNIDSIIVRASKGLLLDLNTCSSGYVEKGNDFGSSSYKEIKAPSIGLLAGDGISPLNAGEVWYFFEKSLSTPFLMLRPNDVLNRGLASLDVLIVPEGRLTVEISKAISLWVDNGGRLILFGESAENFHEEFSIEQKEQDDEFEEIGERDELSSMITGAIYNCEIDKKHSLSFGYESYQTLRQSSSNYRLNSGMAVFELSKDANPISGFVGSKVIKEQGGALIAGQEKFGNGSVTYFIDNPLFRGFWHNGLLMVANAIYLVND